MMLDCLIIGDSIAVGTHQFKPKCAVMAKGGWNTWQWNQKYGRDELTARTVIISLGTNDHKGVKTELELRAIRANARADRVYWILPAIKPDIQDIVRLIAADWGDVILPITDLSTDRVHPTGNGYRQLAKAAQ